MRAIATIPACYLIIRGGKVIDTYLAITSRPGEEACLYRDANHPGALVAVTLGGEDVNTRRRNLDRDNV